MLGCSFMPRAVAFITCRQYSSCGLVGLPNVGKSTLFNALAQKQLAEASNFPFCTIEPNKTKVSVPDNRLDDLAATVGSKRILPAQVEILDIAGLIKGASQGAGLGNQFLGNIRAVEVVLQVVRCFATTEVINTEETVDPIRDYETISTELLLADLQSVEKRLSKKPSASERLFLERLGAFLDSGVAARALLLDDEKLNHSDEALLRSMQLLTAKPLLVIANVDEECAADGNKHSDALRTHIRNDNAAGGAEVLTVCASLEEDVIELGEEGAKTFLLECGLETTGLSKVLQACSRLLQLQTFFTVGPEEARAWPVRVGSTAQACATTIHSDIGRGFIFAETYTAEDIVRLGSLAKCKEEGLMRLEGRDYIAQDGDVFLFRHNT